MESSNSLHQSPINVLLVGKSSSTLELLKEQLKKYSRVRFVTEYATNMKEAFLKTISVKPSCIILDDDFNNVEIETLTKEIQREETISETPISILKSSNDRQIVNSNIQDYILKETISGDRLANSIINLIRFKKTNRYLYLTYKKGKKRLTKFFSSDKS